MQGVPRIMIKTTTRSPRKSVVETVDITCSLIVVAGLHSDNSLLTPDQQEEIEEAALALLRIFQNLKPFLRYKLFNDVASKLRSRLLRLLFMSQAQEIFPQKINLRFRGFLSTENES